MILSRLTLIEIADPPPGNSLPTRLRKNVVGHIDASMEVTSFQGFRSPDPAECPMHIRRVSRNFRFQLDNCSVCLYLRTPMGQAALSLLT